jgi:von Willebrand factor type A domain.
MDVLQNEMTEFVDTVHEDGRCLGAVTTFNTSVQTNGMSPEATEVKKQLRDTDTGGKTALYDSIIASVSTWQRGRIKAQREHVPALLITVTDGRENASDATLSDVRKAIRKTGFHPKNRCYFAIVGVGDASASELRNICEGGHGVYQHVSNMDQIMKLVLAATLVGVVRREQYQEIRKKANEVELRELRRELASVGLRKLDYMLNVDTSGSMSESA